jgi:hypothetical protein
LNRGFAAAEDLAGLRMCCQESVQRVATFEIGDFSAVAEIVSFGMGPQAEAIDAQCRRSARRPDMGKCFGRLGLQRSFVPDVRGKKRQAKCLEAILDPARECLATARALGVAIILDDDQ